MRTVKQSFGVVVAGLLSLASCAEEPQELSQYFDWQESVTDMRDALLGTCSFDGTIYTVGGLSNAGAVFRFTSRRWLQEATTLGGKRLWSCWSGPQSTIFAVGQEGTILRHSAEGWGRDSAPDEVQKASLYGVWAMADGTAIAVGGGLSSPTETAVILHFDGESWSRMDASQVRTRTLRAVWGSSADNYWAVGDDGAIAHFDGERWLPSPSNVTDRLYGIYGSGPDDMYAVGGTGRGLVLRWNGSSWLQFDQPAESLRAVWTGPAQALFVGGDNGYVARYSRRNALPEPGTRIQATPFPHLRINTLLGQGRALLGAASTMETGEDGDWRGAVVSHGRSFAGPVFEDSTPDAGAPSQQDAGSQDAGSQDAGSGAADADNADGS